MVLGGTWLILLSNPAALGPALFEVISAFTTCGLSLALTPELDALGRVVLMLVMCWGRLGSLTVVLVLGGMGVPTLVRYPVEQILIG